MVGLPKHVPFLKSRLPLRVGQTVRFRIVSRGDDVQAVDIGVESEVRKHQENPMPKLTADTIDLNKLLKSARSPSLDSEDIMSSVPAHSRSRCFLRRMSQFQNSSQAEQVQLVIEAEKSLDRLLGQSTLDGDAICRLARKCSSWLHPPVLQTTNPQRQSDHKTARGTEDQVHLQERIRKILILALNHLDLQDVSTFEAMKAALFYMASLCQRLEGKRGFSSTTLPKTPARKQWLELKGLLEDSGLKSLVSGEMSCRPPCPRVEDQSKPRSLPNTANTQDQMKEMADAERIVDPEQDLEFKRTFGRVEGGCYEPNARVKALSTVSQGTPVKLVCSECPFTMMSSWYRQHPKTLKRSVIAPQKGHKTCRQKVKNCFWKNLDGGPVTVVRALVSSLEYCPHGRLLCECASCGGGSMCIHAIRRNRCKDCKHLHVGHGGRRVARTVMNSAFSLYWEEAGPIVRNWARCRQLIHQCEAFHVVH